MKSARLSLLLLMALSCFALAPSNALAEENLPALIKKIEPSAVIILTYDKQGKPLAQGSGFFINELGDIITNVHVLAGANRTEVKTSDGKIYLITRIVAEDREGDVVRATVDIPSKLVHPLSLSGSVPEVGERIAVIGSPLGLERTVSDGIVSAVRDIPAFGKIYQITAPISPGSSGGPVVNMKGEVIGVATFQVVGGQNLNFVVPSERIEKLIQIKKKSFVESATHAIKDWFSPAEELYLTGLNLIKKGDCESALPWFKKAVKKNPAYAEAHFYVGYCNGTLGHYTDAIEPFKQAIRNKPDFYTAYFCLGDTYNMLNRYAEATEALKEAVRIKPDAAEAHFCLGTAYRGLGRDKDAIESYKRAIQINPNYFEPHYNLGIIYNKRMLRIDAIKEFKEAVRIKPNDYDAHLMLGGVYLLLDRNIEAVEEYKKAIRIMPDGVNAHIFLGMAHDKAGRYAEAVDAFKEAIRIKPDNADALIYLGGEYSELGLYKEAVQAYKQSINISPNQADTHYLLAEAYIQLRCYEEALESYKQAIQLRPNYAEAHYRLGCLLKVVYKDKASALAEYNILKDLDKDLANSLFELINE